MPRAQVILDFAGSRPLRFDALRRIIEARGVAEVRPALREAERAARAGAWVAGFVAWEAAPAFDAAMQTLPPSDSAAPLLWFGVFDEPMQDSARGDAAAPLDWTTAATRAGYDRDIAEIRDAIAAGDVYQVNHTVRFHAPCTSDPRALYDALASARHGRYHALIETDVWAIVSASPELFLDIVDGRITTRPMKGTIRRGRWLEEDAHARERLRASAKDRAENLMIVDLLRNDIGRVATYGSVGVPQLFAVETYPTVHQMTSTITASLRDDASIDDVFAATFPCGSVSGAPKIAAMQMIARLETEPRGVYCGAIGVLRPDGSATFNVAIRTITIDRVQREATYGTGGGITWDSHADAEYDELLAKALLLDAPLPDFELLETMRLEDGIIRRLELHLERLRESATYFGWDAARVSGSARVELRALCDVVTEGSWRIRLTVNRAASCSIERTRLLQPAGNREETAVKRVALARAHIDSGDVLLFHKTTARAVYEEHRVADAFDALLYNEHGFVTEFTTGNLVVEIDGALFTPPRGHGLLAGTFRRELLLSGAVRERALRPADVSGADRVWHVNSVREWTRVLFFP